MRALRRKSDHLTSPELSSNDLFAHHMRLGMGGGAVRLTAVRASAGERRFHGVPRSKVRPMNWRRVCCLLTQALGLAALVMLGIGLLSPTIRSHIPVLVDRQIARIWSFSYVVVGDSLA